MSENILAATQVGAGLAVVTSLDTSFGAAVAADQDIRARVELDVTVHGKTV